MVHQVGVERIVACDQDHDAVLFAPAGPNQAVRAVPGAGLRVPIWLLGSSLFSAQLAGQMGLPYAFASHFAPGDLDEALALYRARFQPTEFGERPRFMLAVNVFAADTDEAKQLIDALTADGGKVTMPFDQAPWGGYFGQCEDKYAIAWNVSVDG